MKRAFFAVMSLCIGLQAQSLAQTWRSYTNINPIRQVLAEGGTLWAATEGGVFSFSAADTALLDVYTNVDGLPSTDVTCAARDSRGRLYFGTAGAGLAVLDSARTRFTRITSRDQNIISDTINAVLCHGDYVFLGSPGGLSFHDGSAWRTYSNRIYAIGEEVRALAYGRDTLWVGHDHGVTAAPISAVLNAVPGQWRNWTDVGSTLNDVNHILVADTSVYLCFQDGISRRLNGTWYKLGGETPSFNANVTCLAVLRDTFYYGTGVGFFRYTFPGGRVAMSAGLPSLDCKTLALASDSTIWTGTAEGLARRDGAAWKPFRQDCLPRNSVSRAAAGPDGSIWLAHGGAFASRIRPGGAFHAFEHPVPGIPVTALAVDQAGQAWYGLAWWDASGKSYVVRIRPDDSLAVITSPPLPPRLGIYDIFVDERGYSYLAGHGNVATNYIIEFSPQDSVRWINDPALPVNHLKPTSLAKDNLGNLWSGTFEYMFARYHLADNTWQYFGTEAGLSTVQFWDIAVEPSGTMWLASKNGLNRCRFEPASGRLEDVVVYQTASSPLLGSEIRAVALDRSGNRWIATDRGLSMLSWDGRWTGFTSGDAFANGSRILCDDVKCVAVRPRDASGDDILVATTRGLSVYSHYAAADQFQAQAFVAPNPFRPGRDRILMFSNLPDRASVSLHALDGRKIGSWQGPAAPSHILYADTDILPGGLPSGLYLCVIRPPAGKSRVIKLAVVR